MWSDDEWTKLGWKQNQDGSWVNGSRTWRPPSTTAARSWTCKVCNSTNWSPKTKCSVCNVKKSFQPQPGQPSLANAVPPPQQGVAAQLSAVASKLLQAAPTTAPPSTAAPSAPPSASGDLTKAQRQAQIKQLEAALIPLQGVEHQELRSSIVKQVAEHKQALISDKPLGQRRDNCKDALERAKKRTLQAREALALAEQTVQAAEAEEQRLTQELTDLQHELAEAPVPEEGLDALRAHLAAACDKVASLPGAPADAADHAKSLSADLLSRFEKAFEEQAEAPTGQHASTPRRHSTKSEPVPGVDTSAPGMPVGTRYHGKQPFKGPVQQPLTNYFTIPAAMLAAARPPRPRSAGATDRFAPYPTAGAGSSAQRAASARPTVTFADAARKATM